LLGLFGIKTDLKLPFKKLRNQNRNSRISDVDIDLPERQNIEGVTEFREGVDRRILKGNSINIGGKI
jgi:hypothetical protein